jgi:3-deoxy-manno-octulosonate cytidylyltransferase (CMP-KDO synthetase)
MLGGKTMIQRVYDACIASNLPTYVLTDDVRIASVFQNTSVIIDDTDYANGTERCAGAINLDYMQKYDQFINVQGDMPDVTVEMIRRVKSIIPQSGIATAWTEMKKSLQSDPNTVKLVHNNVYAHWFGRGMTYGSQHLGIYGYTRKALLQYPLYKQSQHEDIEGLEQLRWIDNNKRVAVTRVDFNGIEINAREDMEKWNATTRP